MFKLAYTDFDKEWVKITNKIQTQEFYLCRSYNFFKVNLPLLKWIMNFIIA